ncbi:MAG: hypothetical protein FJ368_05480 [Pelagibacterales bacterium]|nr:hypothetical protein [Pelagibacterales bacterium]
MRPLISAAENLRKAHDFANIAKRMYSSGFGGSRGYSGVSDDLEAEFRRKFDPIAEEFQSHKALKHKFFDFLEAQSKEGFTSKQFEIYRDNFFRRTELEIPSVARFIEKAALSGDSQAVADTIRNLNDEGGYGDVNKMHSNLLAKSHNVHGMRVFNLNPIYPISEAGKSENLVPEVEEYRKAKQQAFEQEYPFVAGNTWAHELAADNMLDNFRKAFFVPYQGYYTPEEYKKVTEFFTAHKDDSVEGGDVEAQHERMARYAAERACKESLKNISSVRKGGLNFLDHQARLWDGMLREIEKAKSKGEIIEPKETSSPSTSVKSSEAKSVKGSNVESSR